MSDIDQAFTQFHATNPQVLADLEASASLAMSRGCKRLGIKCLWESLRLEYALRGSPTRLSNSFTSRYSRLMIERNPRLQTVIETRPLKGANHDDLLGDTSGSSSEYELSEAELEEMELH